MSGFFNMDGAFYKFGNAIADVMILSLMWIIFSIPLITIGASTTALYYVTTRRISDREGYLIKDYFFSFRTNFKNATLLWLFLVFLFMVVILNINLLRQMEFEPLMANILLPLQFVLLVELIITSIYIFPLIARFEMGFRQTLKSAFFMANRHLLTTITSVSIGILIFLAAVYIFEPILLVGMGLYAYMTSYMIMHLFKKYRPELDADDIMAKELAPLPDDIYIPNDINANDISIIEEPENSGEENDSE